MVEQGGSRRSKLTNCSQLWSGDRQQILGFSFIGHKPLKTFARPLVSDRGIASRGEIQSLDTTSFQPCQVANQSVLFLHLVIYKVWWWALQTMPTNLFHLQLLWYQVWWWALEREDMHLGTQAKLEVCFIHFTFRERKTKRAIELLDKTPTHILRPLSRMISTSLYRRFGGNEQKRGP